MAYYPLVIPLSVFKPFRKAILHRFNRNDFKNITYAYNDFDSGFGHWWNDIYVQEFQTRNKTSIFCFLTVIGNYLYNTKNTKVDLFGCEIDTLKKKDDRCYNYIHPGIHWAYRNCIILRSCTGEMGIKPVAKQRGIYESRITDLVMNELSEIMSYGSCYAARLNNCPNEQLPKGCTIEMATTIHPSLLNYSNDTLDMSIVDSMYQPDHRRKRCEKV
jgi:hypothetical protein